MYVYIIHFKCKFSRALRNTTGEFEPKKIKQVINKVDGNNGNESIYLLAFYHYGTYK